MTNSEPLQPSPVAGAGDGGKPADARRIMGLEVWGLGFGFGVVAAGFII
jgi:hypothetical protein